MTFRTVRSPLENQEMYNHGTLKRSEFIQKRHYQRQDPNQHELLSCFDDDQTQRKLEVAPNVKQTFNQERLLLERDAHLLEEQRYYQRLKDSEAQ